jgi:hypothetical protein
MVDRSPVTGNSTSATRGSERLLWDCATIGRAIETDPVSARARLDVELGQDLTRLLLLTLRESEPSTPHEEALWRAAQDDAAA